MAMHVILCTYGFLFIIEYEPCPAWRTWPEVFGASTESGVYYTAMFMYTAVGVSVFDIKTTFK